MPVIVRLGAWALDHLPVGRRLGVRMEVLVAGGPAMCDEFMDELREIHLGPGTRLAPPSTGPSVQARLEAAYDAVVASEAQTSWES